MQRTIILLSSLALSATTFTLADTAFAQPADGPEREPTTRTEALSRAGEAFSRLDINGDGVLSPADRETRIAEDFSKADSDGNGQLSLAEATAAHEARRDNRRERISERRESSERMGRRGGRGMRGMRNLGAIARNADADDNGEISANEFETAALTRFDRADADGDGTITMEERRDARRDAMRGQRGRRGGPGA